MCYFTSQSAVGRQILGTCPIGKDCEVVGTVKNDTNAGDWSPVITEVEKVEVHSSAEGSCTVADPTNTPLNVRAAPDGEIVGTLVNGNHVIVLEQAIHSGKGWVYVGRAGDHTPIGWVFQAYLNCGASKSKAQAASPSFDCKSANASDERAICHNDQLASEDRELAIEYSWGLNHFKGGFRTYLQQMQRAWLIRRHACGGDSQCISKAYDERLAELGDGDIELSDYCRDNKTDVDCQSHTGLDLAPRSVPPVTPAVSQRTDHEGSVDGEEANILASVKYDGKARARLEYGDLVITIDREPTSDKSGWLPIVDAEDKAGKKLFSIRLTGEEARGRDEPTAELRVMHLSPGQREPQVVFTYFWGGAHCCTVTQIATIDPSGNWHVIDGGALDGDGYEFRDLDNDGGAELLSVDNSFLYAFGCYACSYAPTRIKKLSETQLTDVTTDPRYREFLLKRLQLMEADGSHSGESGAMRSAGYLGGWVAAKSLVGEFSDAWRTMLNTYEANDDWPMEECLRPLPMDQCSKSEQHETDFPHALAAHLVVNGYITAAEKNSLTYQASERPSNDVQPQTETPRADPSTPLGLCGAAINDPLREMLIDMFISGGKHLGGGLTASIKEEIERDYGSFVTIRNDATVESVDRRTGKIGCAVTYEADLQGLAEKVLQEGANTRAKILIGQMAHEGKEITRRLPYTVQRTSGGSFMVWLGLR